MTKLKQLYNELNDIQESLMIACQNDALIYIDIMYIAQNVQDIKQKIRIEKAKDI